MTLRVAVIGLGYWGPNLARVIAGSPDAELAAVCDARGDRLEAVARRHPSATATVSVDEILDSDAVDAMVIATPAASHAPLARAALERGKHVLVEKPFTTRSMDAAELVDLATRLGRTLMVDHVFLYSPPVRALIELCRSRELGELLFVDAVRINLGLVQEDVSVLWDLAPHDLSIIDAVVGRDAVAVSAVGRPLGARDLAADAHVHLDYGEGLLASVHVSWLSPIKIRHFLVGGTSKSALYNDLDRSEPVKVFDRGIDLHPGDIDAEGRTRVLAAHRSGHVFSPEVERHEPLEKMLAAFIDSVRTGAPSPSDGRQGLRIVRVLEAAEQSLRRGGGFVPIGEA